MTTTSDGATTRHHRSTCLDAGIVDGWRSDWDAMMSVYLPGGDRAMSIVLDTIEHAGVSSQPRVLDLGGGRAPWPPGCYAVGPPPG
jgi:hypothetical protein